MFDVGFSEMVVIAVVALVVIGPERLPKVARTLGHLVGRLQRYVNDVKSDINREMELEELRKLKDEFQTSARNIEQTIHGGVQQAEAEVKSISEQVGDIDGRAEDPVLVAAGPPKPVGDSSQDGKR